MYTIKAPTDQTSASTKRKAIASIKYSLARFRFCSEVADACILFCLVHVRCQFLLVNANIIFTYFIERMLEVILYIIQTYEYKAVQYGHYIFQVSRKVIEGTGKVRPVDDRKYIDEYFAIGTQRYGGAVCVDDLQVIERNDHFTDILVDARDLATLHTILAHLHRHRR